MRKDIANGSREHIPKRFDSRDQTATSGMPGSEE
nr:MAG TPA: hypothetical protein [Caudoviricetes sp.]DAT25323.1 MAG TPA: hypothetical protein [Caudoviricetes sp.]